MTKRSIFLSAEGILGVGTEYMCGECIRKDIKCKDLEILTNFPSGICECDSMITWSLTSPSLTDLTMPFSEHAYSQTERLLSHLHIVRIYTIVLYSVILYCVVSKKYEYFSIKT